MKNGKRLYKSSTDKQIMGVCGGLGDYFGIDPTIIRVIFLILFFTWGTGFLLYLVLGIVLPYDYQVSNVTRKTDSNNRTNPFGGFGQPNPSNKTRRDVTPEKDSSDDESKWSDF
ncbi:PspC domain-containing protein [Fundicoccus culcitae]|uniref:PspC domain-containing protein n=1 Tax=Fundicoccus culcitae TaxID=2969821 RepID=A0ABY5P2Y5_9LACT|nr:PspC domain-containing protein [Fundicoccus culcitae]UUX32924.1 PspC domain-containing protein [Fundicoccus culcitae]